MSERVKEIVPDLIEAVRNVLRRHKVTFDEYRAGFGYMIGVQEAKEIPTVKILDAPVLPTKKLFPGPIALTCFGTLLGLAGGAAWLVFRKRWKEGDPTPGRLLVEEIGTSLYAGTRRFVPTRAAAETKSSNGAP